MRRLVLILVALVGIGILTLSSAIAEIAIRTSVIERGLMAIYDGDRTWGTGFLLEIPMKSEPTKVRVVLVTARHVIDPAWACGKPV